MISDVSTSVSTTHEEELPMTDDKIYTNDGSAAPSAPVLTEHDNLLMYKAQQNVKNKKNLVKHICAYIAAWPILLIIYETILSAMVHPQSQRAIAVVESLNRTRGNVGQAHRNPIDSAIRFINLQVIDAYIPPIWYVLIGIMAAWGGWITIRALKHWGVPALNRYRGKTPKKAKPDPVLQEFNRLKALSETE